MKKSTTVKTKTKGYVWIDTCYTFDRGWGNYGICKRRKWKCIKLDGFRL